MTTVTFDTLQLTERLKAAGIPPEQAEAIVHAIVHAQDELVTKQHLDLRLHEELGPVRSDLAVLKWMMGVLIAGTLSLILKAFA